MREYWQGWEQKTKPAETVRSARHPGWSSMWKAPMSFLVRRRTGSAQRAPFVPRPAGARLAVVQLAVVRWDKVLGAAWTC